MTSVFDRKTQGGPGGIHAIQENNPPKRLTRLEKAKLEALEAFGNCHFDSMVFKKKDFRTKLKASTSARKPVKRKNQGDDCVASHGKMPTRKLTCLQELTDGAANVDKVGLKNGQKRGEKVGISTTYNSRRQSRRVSSRVGSTSSVTSGKRLTRVEKARLEAMQSFGEQGLDAVWKSCTQIMSKTLDKKERENDKDKSMEEQVSHETIGDVGTSGVILCEAENSLRTDASSTVPETGPLHTAASMDTSVQCNSKHQDTLETCTPPEGLNQVPKASQEALQSAAGLTFDDNKTSSRMDVTPLRNEVTHTEPCEELDLPSSCTPPKGMSKVATSSQEAPQSAAGPTFDDNKTSSRMDLTTLRNEVTHTEPCEELDLPSSYTPPKGMSKVATSSQEALQSAAGLTFDDNKTSSQLDPTTLRNEVTHTESCEELDSPSSCTPPKGMIQVQKAHQEALQSTTGQTFDENKTSSRMDLTPQRNEVTHTESCEELDSPPSCTPPKGMIQVQKAHQEALQSTTGQTFDDNKTSSRMDVTTLRNEVTHTEPCEELDSPSCLDGSLYDKQYPEQRIDLFSSLQGDASFANREALMETSERVVRTARNLETPSPQESTGATYGHSSLFK